MFLIFLLSPFILSALKPSDNPYQILGVPTDATKEQIRSSFRKLTLKYHPDLNKQNDTTWYWAQINDAFELLNDPDRKAHYDRTGFVADDLPTHTPGQSDDLFTELSEHFFKKQQPINIQPKTPLITQENYEHFISTPISDNNFQYINKDSSVECLILVYMSSMDLVSDCYLEVFEHFYTFSQYQIKCGRIDTATSAQFARDLGAKGLPSIMYIHKNLTTGEVKIEHMTDRIESVFDIAQFLASQWKLGMIGIQNIDHYSSFLNYYDQRIKIIEVCQGTCPSFPFQRFAAKYRNKALFASINDDTFKIGQQLGAKRFPAYFLYRNPNTEPLSYKSIISLTLGLENFKGPTMAQLTRLNFPSLCGPTPLIRVGPASDEVINDLIYQPFPTFWVDANSRAVKKLGADENDWIDLDLNAQKYYIIKNQKHQNETYLIIHSSATMMNQKTLPPNFNIDLDLTTAIGWWIIQFSKLTGLITFNLIDWTITILVFGFFGYKKFIGYAEERKHKKQKNEKYHHNISTDARATKKFVQENLKKNLKKNETEKKDEQQSDPSEKPLTLDDYPVD